MTHSLLLALVCLFVVSVEIWTVSVEVDANGAYSPLPRLDNENDIVERFQEYLRIDTRQPSPDYKGVMKFLRRLSDEFEIPFEVLEYVPGKPIGLFTWSGTNDDTKSILFNSHTDVVPVDEAKWNSPPFDAHIDQEGRIFARGAQDMKCVGLSLLESLSILKREGFKPKRTIYVSFVPDEEIGGENGLKQLTLSDKWKQMNVGLGFDEGGPLDEEPRKFTVFYGERQVWWFKFIARGEENHSSVFTPNTATEKISRVIAKIFEFRAAQEREIALRPSTKVGDVATINVNEMLASKNGSLNVTPGIASIGVDMRIPPHHDPRTVLNMLKKWAEDADVELKFLYGGDDEEFMVNPTTDPNSFWFTKFTSLLQDKLGYRLDPTIFRAATDARYVRRSGVPCIGFSALDATPWLLHDHNEFIRRDTYLNMVKIYKEIVAHLSNVEDE